MRVFVFAVIWRTKTPYQKEGKLNEGSVMAGERRFSVLHKLMVELDKVGGWASNRPEGADVAITGKSRWREADGPWGGSKVGRSTRGEN